MWVFKLIILQLLAGPVAMAVDDSNYYICKNDKIVRTLRVEKKEGRCRSLYTKRGRVQEIGSGMNFGSCVKIVNDVKKNLTDNGWTCVEAQSSGFSDLSEKPTQ